MTNYFAVVPLSSKFNYHVPQAMLRRIPAAVFTTENTRIYPIKRRRWKQNWNSVYLDPSKCFQKLKNVAVHFKELVVYHCFEERI